MQRQSQKVRQVANLIHPLSIVVSAPGFEPGTAVVQVHQRVPILGLRIVRTNSRGFDPCIAGSNPAALAIAA
jgi:hypothetical protein